MRQPQSALAAARPSHEGAAPTDAGRNEFLSDYGVRALSKVHERDPFRFSRGNDIRSGLLAGRIQSGLFGGNSNWRGPIWMPVNYLLIESLQKIPPLLRRRFQNRMPDRLREIHDHQRSRR